MNLYLRYFDNEVLVYSADEALDFLRSIPEINVTKDLEDDLRSYVDSDVCYPKRYKVRPRVYFIVIKSEAATMEDFKSKKMLNSSNGTGQRHESPEVVMLNEVREGWYEGRIEFKRVVQSQATGKCEYVDTVFCARVKAMSGMECYNIICEHLLSRVDNRSQMPSPKGKNFNFTYLGRAKQL